MKRFTETSKWIDPWFHRLTPGMKLLWHYLCDNCDAAGVIDLDLDIAAFHVGVTADKLDVAKLGDRLEQLPCGKYWLPKFIRFQYGALSPDCKAHNPAFASLRQHGLEERVSKGYPKGIHTPQEKEKVQDQEKEKVKGECEGGGKAKGTEDEIKTYLAERGLPAADAEWFFNKNVGNGWKNGSNQIKDWRATVRSWQAAGYFPSQKATQGAQRPQTRAEQKRADTDQVTTEEYYDDSAFRRNP